MKVLWATWASIFLAATAVSADSHAESIEPWWGGYLGGSLTYAQGEVNARHDLEDLLSAEGIDKTLGDLEGWSGAIRAGFDWQYGGTVAGVGASYDFGKYDDTKYDAIRTEVSNSVMTFGRVGYDFGSVLPYLLAGYTWADGEASIDGFGSENVELDGRTFGLGAEFKLSQNWTGVAEFTYTDFGEVEKSQGQISVDLQRLNFGVNYRF